MTMPISDFAIRDWVDASAAIHGLVSIVLCALAIRKCFRAQRQFAMIGLISSYLILTFVNVLAMIHWGRVDSPWLWASFCAWLAGDASLIWLLIFCPFFKPKENP